MSYLEQYKASLERSKRLIKQLQQNHEEHEDLADMSEEDFAEVEQALEEHVKSLEKTIQLEKDLEQE